MSVVGGVFIVFALMALCYRSVVVHKNYSLCLRLVCRNIHVENSFVCVYIYVYICTYICMCFLLFFFLRSTYVVHIYLHVYLLESVLLLSISLLRLYIVLFVFSLLFFSFFLNNFSIVSLSISLSVYLFVLPIKRSLHYPRSNKSQYLQLMRLRENSILVATNRYRVSNVSPRDCLYSIYAYSKMYVFTWSLPRLRCISCLSDCRCEPSSGSFESLSQKIGTLDVYYSSANDSKLFVYRNR